MSASKEFACLSDPRLQALTRLEDVHGQAATLVRALSEAAGESPPAWLLVFEGQLESIGEAMDGLSRLVRAEVNHDYPA